MLKAILHTPKIQYKPAVAKLCRAAAIVHSIPPTIANTESHGAIENSEDVDAEHGR